MELIMKLEDAATGALLLDIFKRLTIAEGVDFTVQKVPQGVLLRPVALTPEERDQAWARVQEIIDQPKLREGQPKMSPEEEEQWVAEQVLAFRAERRAQQQP